MSILNSSIVPVSGATSYDIDNSLRFNDDDSAYLSRTPSSAGNQKTWTWSGWVKRSNVDVTQTLFTAVVSENNRSSLAIQGAGTIQFLEWRGGAPAEIQLKSSSIYRDPSSWYHILLAVDISNASTKLYVNGVEAALGTNVQPSTSVNTVVNSTATHYTAAEIKTWSAYCDGYLAEVNFVDGQALTPSDFGETGTYGEWKAKAYEGTYGTNGFYLDFSNKATKHTVTANGNIHHDTARSKIGASSLEFDGASDYLTVPQSSDWAFGDGDFTIEYWVNMWNTPSSTQYQHLGQENGTDYWRINHNSSRIEVQFEVGGSTQLNFSTSGAGSQITAANVWYHIAVVKNGSTVTCYLDGASVGSSTWSGNMGEVATSLWIGNNRNNTGWMDGFMDEIRISNTARYTSSFTPSTVAFTEDSNTKLLIHSDTTDGSTTFTDSSGVVGGLGNDQGGGENHWTPNNLAATDQMLDSPTNNFCTWNPINNTSTGTFKEGNLYMSDPSDSASFYGQGSYSMSTGKWYFEGNPLTSNGNGSCRFGVSKNNGVAAADIAIYNGADGASNGVGGGYEIEGTTTTGKASYLTGDVIGCALNLDSNTIEFFKNNVSQGSVSISSTEWTPHLRVYSNSGADVKVVANFGQDSSFAGNKTAQGNADDNGYGDFYYTPPTGYLALCTQNLPEPTVVPSEHFNASIWTADGTSRTYALGSFAPDLVWYKSRSDAESHRLLDTVRGDGTTYWKSLYSNTTGAETEDNNVTNISGSGITVVAAGNSPSISGRTYVAWNWKANGAGVSNTDGSITSTVSANVDAGFSIVSYTGTGSAATVGHGLNSAPELIIEKRRAATGDWYTQFKFGSQEGLLYLDLTNAKDTLTTNITSTLWSIYSTDAVSHIAYAFHSVEGYSKVGSYTGNGSTDGTFVHCGFRPAYVMVKVTSIANDWVILDGVRSDYNPADEYLTANNASTESSNLYNMTDFTANGFKLRDTQNGMNGSNDYIFIAFAEHPFKYTNAR